MSRHPLEDLSDLGFEPHVQHPVGLVKDDVEDLGEVDLVGIEEVVEPSGGGDEDGGTGLDVPQLLTLGGSAVGAGRTADGQVRSLTQFYSVDFSKSSIGVIKCVFNKRRFVPVVFDSVLGPPHLAHHT